MRYSSTVGKTGEALMLDEFLTIDGIEYSKRRILSEL